MKKIQLTDGMPTSVKKEDLKKDKENLLVKIKEECLKSRLSYVEVNKAIYLADKEFYKSVVNSENSDIEVGYILGHSEHAIREIEKVYKQHEDIDTVIVEPNSWVGKELLGQSRKLIDLEHSLAELTRSINELKKS